MKPDDENVRPLAVSWTPTQARRAVSTLAALRPESFAFGHGRSIVDGAAQRLEELDRSLD
jgi:hypothetical protein